MQIRHEAGQGWVERERQRLRRHTRAAHIKKIKIKQNMWNVRELQMDCCMFKHLFLYDAGRSAGV